MPKSNINQQPQSTNFMPDLPKNSVVGHKSHWLLVGIVVFLLVVTFVSIWYVNMIGKEAGYYNPVQTQNRSTGTADINLELDSINTVDLNSEFNSIDTDLESL